MPNFPPQGQLATIITIAVLAAAGLFATANIWTNTQTFTTTSVFKTSNTHNIANFTNSSGIQVATITDHGVWTGAINNPIGADYTIAINGTGYFVEYNGKTNQILKSSTNTTDAASVLQDALNRANASAALGRGGWIDVDCGSYPIRHVSHWPKNGNTTLTGHGLGCTLFFIPGGSNSNFIDFTGVSSLTSFFNYIAHFGINNAIRSGTNNTAFKFDSTNKGISDTTLEDLNIQNFGKDDIFFSSVNTWNNKIVGSTIEHAGRADLYMNGGQDPRILNNKFLFNHGRASIVLNGTVSAQIIGNYFNSNDYADIYMDNNTKWNQIVGNNFQVCSTAGSGKADCIDVSYANQNQINSNFFNAGNPNYLINFLGNGTASTSNFQIVGNQIGTNGVNGFVNFANSLAFGALKFYDIRDNFVLGTYPNCIFDTHDPSKSACFSGTQNYARSHTFNYTLPNANGTLALQPQSNFTTGHTSGNSTATASTTQVMLGNYATITPTVTGNIRIYVSGVWDNGITTDGCRADVRISTSNMGANGAALAGTLVGTNFKMIGSGTSQNQTFSKIVASTGNAVNTKLFVDLSFNRITAGACAIRNVDWFLQEY